MNEDVDCDEIRSPLRMAAAASAREATVIRRGFRSWAELDIEPDVVEDLTLAVYEALSNVVDHAYSAADHHPQLMRIHARRYRDRVVVTVADRGHWRHDGTGSNRGRGLRMMRSLVDDLSPDLAPGGP